MPLSLLMSPRDRIQLDANISLLSGMSDAQKVDLEKEVETGLNVSALVEEIGGLGTYPSMIMLTTDLNWLVETIAHEWVHNYLTLHPLGQNYETNPELRTMNETTANLAGKEIGLKVIGLYYPNRIPVSTTISPIAPTAPATPPVFDFREEMRITREHVDQLLAAGEIEEAEAYMEVRRHVFWDNGYMIRRINQAYFAFHGAYNDTPGGGASGTDPVGPAVVILREKCGSLGEFLRTIASMSSYGQLETAISAGVISPDLPSLIPVSSSRSGKACSISPGLWPDSSRSTTSSNSGPRSSSPSLLIVRIIRPSDCGSFFEPFQVCWIRHICQAAGIRSFQTKPSNAASYIGTCAMTTTDLSLPIILI